MWRNGQSLRSMIVEIGKMVRVAIYKRGGVYRCEFLLTRLSASNLSIAKNGRWKMVPTHSPTQSGRRSPSIPNVRL